MLSTGPTRSALTRRARIGFASVLLVVALAVAGVRAQRFSTFSGTVTDQTNAVLPNVAVAVINAAAQTRHEVRTDRTGHFELPGLTDGDYQVAIDEPGFDPIRESVSLTGRDVTRAFQMQLGNLHETISVTSGPVRPPDLDMRAKARQSAEQRMQKVADRCAGAGNAAPAAAANIGGNILQPWKIVDVKPRYPENLQAAKVGGVVSLDALIGTDGTIRDLRVLDGDPDLGAAAADAVRQWEFSPTYLNCQPVEVKMRVTVMFKP